jgi:uncharacterized protein YceH (UPF0502 family)
MELNAVEIRILGCLVEKESTVPDSYPLSTNSLVTACNQRSNRDPVIDYDQRTIDTALLELRSIKGLARTITGGRSNKHRHVLDEAWGLDSAELAVLAVLMLRGPQTPGELRTRTERMHDFAELDGVEAVLSTLAHRDDPLVRQLTRQPGQKESRWEHQLGIDGDGDKASPAVVAPSSQPAAPVAGASPTTSVEELRGEVEQLRADVDRLYELLGETP